mmetsp:Transcript_3885/g.5745  ORF Transcript_3885/g.5745 Transcript_3885/m.5745 type:complete len:634 (+) Transcript_3885:73-1974(+)
MEAPDNIQQQQQLLLEQQKRMYEEKMQNNDDLEWWKNENFNLSTESYQVQNEKLEKTHKLLIKGRKNVVKLYTSPSIRSFSYPWQVRNSGTKVGSGLIFDHKKRRILTNAHCVANSASLCVQRYGTPLKYEARVLVIGHQADLALITVDDPAFWEDINTEENDCIFSSLPPLQSHATVIGFPTGGDNLSITRGVVSRIEMRNYVNSTLLCIQIDAQIIPGNSGGPAFNDDGKVIGIAFQYLPNLPNVGFIIPTEVIQHFLEGVERNKGIAAAVCFTGLSFQYVENASHRQLLKIEKVGMLLIDKIFGNLLPGDVAIAIDGHSISRDGTCILRDDEQINFNYFVRQKFLGDKVTFTVLRNGEQIDVDHYLYDGNCLVPDVNGYNCEPTYIMVGGLLFIPLSMPHLREWYGDDWSQKAPFRVLMDVFHGNYNRKLILEDIPEEVICISHILPHKINLGYSISHVTQVTHFNDKRVFNMFQFLSLIFDCQEDYFRFKTVSNHEMILSKNAVVSSMNDLFQQHGLTAWYSPNLDTNYQYKLTSEKMPEITKKFIRDTIYVGVDEKERLSDDCKLPDSELLHVAELSKTPLPPPVNTPQDQVFDQQTTPQVEQTTTPQVEEAKPQVEETKPQVEETQQ